MTEAQTQKIYSPDAVGADELPPWLLPEGAFALRKSYLLAGETIAGLYRRVAVAAGKYAERSSGTPTCRWRGADVPWATAFFDAIWQNWLCPASPVLSNMGTDRGLPISCNSIHVADSVDGIFGKVHESAVLTKHGAGLGIYMGDVRGRGSVIKGNGTSKGVIPWLNNFQAMILSVSQGNTRRGSAAFYLPVEHSDADEFTEIRRATGDPTQRVPHMHHGMSVTDAWMEDMLAGNPEKRALWLKILRTRLETGEPYLMFADSVNNRNPEGYKRLGLKVSTSNLCCLEGSTLVLTKEHGPVAIEELVGKEVTIFDGETWVKNDTFALRGEDDLYAITLSDGTVIEANGRHRWFVTQGPALAEVTTLQLSPGDVLEPVQLPNGTSWSTFRVISVEKTGRRAPVYCPTVPSTGKFALACGVMTGNSEITLYTDKDHTFVCCLSSLNVARFDAWGKLGKNPTEGLGLGALATRFLDAVLDEFIEKAKASGQPRFEPAIRSAEKGRAIGIGVLGWHSWLQLRQVEFDSPEAMRENRDVFSTIRKSAEAESRRMAAESGEPVWCVGQGMRHSHLMAVAPTTSNSLIAGGYSMGIEPLAGHVFVQAIAQGTVERLNVALERHLEATGRNTPALWAKIAANQGSLAGLPEFTAEEQRVFATFAEISPRAVIQQAAQRNAWVDQAQSTNLHFALDTPPNVINAIHIEAWRLGVKTLYYCRSNAALSADKLARPGAPAPQAGAPAPALPTDPLGECRACEG